MELILNHTHCPVTTISWGWMAALSMWRTIAIHILISAAVSPERVCIQTPNIIFKREMDSIISKLQK